MPTVPPTFRADDSIFPGVAEQIIVLDASNGPTPDPDMDDVVLVPVVTGDGMGAITSKSSLSIAPAHTNAERRPHLTLSGLTLHSPSSIIGTPFDVSEPRFEYPFPASPPEPDFYQSTAFPAFSGHISTFGSSAPCPPASASSSLSRNETVKVVSPTHPKHIARDPPVPPSLAKKRRSMGISVPPPQLKPVSRARTLSVKTQMREHSTNEKASIEARTLASVITQPASPHAAIAASSEDGQLPVLMNAEVVPDDMQTASPHGVT